MLIELIEIKFSYENKYKLSTVFINPLHIVSMSEDNKTRRDLIEGRINLDISESATFTKIILNESRSFNEMVVVGPPQEVYQKVYNSKKKMLLRD